MQAYSTNQTDVYNYDDEEGTSDNDSDNYDEGNGGDHNDDNEPGEMEQ